MNKIKVIKLFVRFAATNSSWTPDYQEFVNPFTKEVYQSYREYLKSFSSLQIITAARMQKAQEIVGDWASERTRVWYTSGVKKDHNMDIDTFTRKVYNVPEPQLGNYWIR